MKVDKSKLEDVYTEEYLQALSKDQEDYDNYIRDTYYMNDFVTGLDPVLDHIPNINRTLLNAIRYGIDNVVIDPNEVGKVVYTNLVAEKVFEYLNELKKS